MKKLWLLCFLCFAASWSVSCQPTVDLPSTVTGAPIAGANYAIPHYSRPVTVEDDNLRPFNDGLSLELKELEQVILYPDNWSGPADLSARIKLIYGDKHLYLAAEVRDDEIGYAGHPGDWSGDAVNFFLKTETEEGVREFLFKFSCQGTRYVYFERKSYNGEEYLWGSSWASRRPEGYLVKAAIPFRDLGLLHPEESRIWLNASVEDDQQTAYLMLRGQTEGFLNDPEWIPAAFGQK